MLKKKTTPSTDKLQELKHLFQTICSTRNHFESVKDIARGLLRHVHSQPVEGAHSAAGEFRDSTGASSFLKVSKTILRNQGITRPFKDIHRSKENYFDSYWK